MEGASQNSSKGYLIHQNIPIIQFISMGGILKHGEF
jgi:hypothetical protein